MKTNKFKVLILLGILSVYTTGCEKDLSKSYNGTWNFKEFGTSITISPESFVFYGNNGGFTVNSPSWTKVENTNEYTKDDYPLGFIISGEVTDHYGEGFYVTGEIVGEDWAFFIHKDKKSMIEQGLNNRWHNELIREISEE